MKEHRPSEHPVYAAHNAMRRKMGLPPIYPLTPLPVTSSLCSMGKTNLERQQALRARREKAGLQRYELWLNPKHWPTVKRLVDRLMKRESK